MEDYPRLVEASLKLTKILIVQFRAEVELVVGDKLKQQINLDPQEVYPIPF